jgi:hypothetical protein
MITVLDDRVRVVDAELRDARVLVAPEALLDVMGWDLKPQGLCRDDVCVPVRDRDALFVDARLDLAAVAEALGQPIVIDADREVVALALPVELRRKALDAHHAPSFTLNDLDGNPHSLDEWAGKKKLLFAFASW